MATTEQFSLRWNNFHSNLTSGFHELLEAAEMVDVTLAVDGHFFQAHKIVLSICSPYFKQMFKVNPCKHPIVILKDVGHENMKDILEFMYMGEVSVLRENLTQFLRTAELLQVKGLTGDDSSEETSSTKDNDGECDNDEENEMYDQLIETDVELPIYSSTPTQVTPSPTYSKRPSKTSNTSTSAKRPKSEPHQPHTNQQKPVKPEQEPVVSKNEFNSSDMESHSSQNVPNANKPDAEDSKELLSLKNAWENSIGAAGSGDPNASDQGRPERLAGKNLYQCGQCLKRFSRRDHLRTHEKNIHGEFAGPFKCVICEQLYKNTESLRKHIAKFHFSTINETIQRIEIASMLSYSSDNKVYVYCPYCCRKFVNRYNLKVHVRDKHEDNSMDLDCHICGKTMRNQSCLRVHMYHHRKQRLEEAGIIPPPRAPRRRSSPPTTSGIIPASSIY
ncbi:hypothetical protein NQ318_009307 [Aromia moschata]|uniref:Uncharacterized protein n=1 Tax=Aromia moschata TaxID=1265417 RepID=A0AAV8YI52_9CUCU|nr:hypothetical protein NQ318_009307 [Aromia moschata]